MPQHSTRYRVNGEPLHAYCVRLNLPYRRIWKRVSRYGWSVEDAVAKAGDARVSDNPNKRVRKRPVQAHNLRSDWAALIV